MDIVEIESVTVNDVDAEFKLEDPLSNLESYQAGLENQSEKKLVDVSNYESAYLRAVEESDKGELKIYTPKKVIMEYQKNVSLPVRGYLYSSHLPIVVTIKYNLHNP
jgi:hypothetical protein